MEQPRPKMISWPAGTGEMAERIRVHDWASTPLGSAETWPQSLKTTIDLLLPSGFPMIALWGPQLIQVYNDGYRDLMGLKHPAGLGQPTRECWPEVWHINEPIYRRIRAGETLTFENGLYPIARSGRLEDAWFTLTYSPIRDETGAIAGVLVTLIETTGRVLAERALRESEQRYRALFDSMDEAYAVVEVMHDAAKGWNDFLFLEVNSAFMKHTGMPYPVGRTATQILGTPNPHWAEIYGRVVESGEPIRFEEAELTLGRVFDLNVFRLGGPGSRRVAVLFTNVSERKRSEAALRKSQERLRRVLETEAVGVLFFDREGTLIDANDVFLRLTGWSREDMEAGSLDWQRMTPPEWTTESEAQMRTLLETGRIGPYEKEYLCEDGSHSWMLFAGRDLGDGTIVEFAIDINALKKAEDALRDSEARFRGLVEGLAQAVWETNADGVVVEDSPTWRAYTGQTQEEWLGDGWLDAIHPDDRDYAERQWREAVVARRELDAEFRLRRAGGGWQWTNVRAVPLLGPKSRVRKWVGMNIDIGARKEAEAALRDSEERFRLVVENAHDYAIFITDPQDRISDWFPGAETVFGWSAEEIIGRSGAVIFTPQDREAGEPEKEIEIARTGGTAANRRWHLRKDGRRVFIEGSVAALRRQDGSLQGFLKIGQDVTERRAYEETLKASERHAKFLLAELQHRVRNTLGVIRSIARRTAETSETAEDYAMHLEGRIDAFARVQAAVTRDPEAGLDLEMLVADELRAVAAHEGEQVKSISGPRMRLQPKSAETLALAVHELATNAVKYGALAAPEGRIEVAWSVDSSGGHPRLVFRWIETGVPLANARPRRRGFGTELIERTLNYELGGEAQLDFTPDGLHCTIVLPVDAHLFLLDRKNRRHD